MSTHVVILGAGFGGLYTALELERCLPAGMEATIIDRHNFFLFTPFLTEVAGSSIDTRHIVNPIRRLLRRVRFAEATVVAIDLDAREIETRLPDGSPHTFRYDTLILALGAVTSFYGNQGIERFSWSLKTLGDAIAIRNHVIAMLEQADVVMPEQRAPLLTFLVGGGGLTGVEAAGDLNDLVRTAATVYRNVRQEDIRVMVVEGGPRLASELTARLGEFARQALQQQGVEVILNTLIKDADQDTVRLSSGQEIASHTLVWTAGARPNPLVTSLPVERDKHGRITVNPDLSVPGWPNVWAVGDGAAVPDGKGGVFAPTAQNAIREGPVLARNIVARAQAQPTRPFIYNPIGQLAALGHRRGVGTIGPIRLSGFPAWFVWRTYYLYRLPRAEKRIRVALDWALDLVFGRDIVQLPTARTHPPNTGERTRLE